MAMNAQNGFWRFCSYGCGGFEGSVGLGCSGGLGGLGENEGSVPKE